MQTVMVPSCILTLVGAFTCVSILLKLDCCMFVCVCPRGGTDANFSTSANTDVHANAKILTPRIRMRMRMRTQTYWLSFVIYSQGFIEKNFLGGGKFVDPGYKK